jgi:hypothetical protein
MISERWWIAKDLAGSSCGLILRYYPGIRLEGLGKITKNLAIRIASRWGLELNPGPPEKEVGVLTIRPWHNGGPCLHSVLLWFIMDRLDMIQLNTMRQIWGSHSSEYINVRGSMFLQNIHIYLQVHTALRPTQLTSRTTHRDEGLVMLVQWPDYQLLLSHLQSHCV